LQWKLGGGGGKYKRSPQGVGGRGDVKGGGSGDQARGGEALVRTKKKPEKGLAFHVKVINLSLSKHQGKKRGGEEGRALNLHRGGADATIRKLRGNSTTSDIFVRKEKKKKGHKTEKEQWLE